MMPVAWPHLMTPLIQRPTFFLAPACLAWCVRTQHVVGLTVNIPHLFLNGLKVIVAPTEDAVLRVRVREEEGVQ